MYCIWRRRASKSRMRCASAIASAQALRQIELRRVGRRSARPAASPSSCSACTSRLRCDLARAFVRSCSSFMLRSLDGKAGIIAAFSQASSSMTTELKTRPHGGSALRPRRRTAARDRRRCARLRARAGRERCETEVSEGFGQTVTVRSGEVETIEYNRDKGIGVTVYLGKRRGHASTSDFSPQALRDTVDAALSIARFTASDDCAGLADEATAGARDSRPRSVSSVGPAGRARDRNGAAPARAAAFRRRPAHRQFRRRDASRCSSRISPTAIQLGFLAGYPSSRH